MRQNMKKLIALVLACVLSMGLLPAMHVEASMAVFPFSVGGNAISILNEKMDPENGIWDVDVYMGDSNSCLTFFHSSQSEMAQYTLYADGNIQTQITFDCKFDGFRNCTNPAHTVYGYQVQFPTPQSGTQMHLIEVYDANNQLVLTSHANVYSLSAYQSIIPSGYCPFCLGGYRISLWNSQVNYAAQQWNPCVYMCEPDSALAYFSFDPDYMAKCVMYVDGALFPQTSWDERDGKAVIDPNHTAYGFKVPFATPATGTQTHDVYIYEKDTNGNLKLVFESHPEIYSQAAYALHNGDTQIYSGGFDISLWNNQYTQTTWNANVHMSRQDSCLNFFRNGQGSMQGYTMTVDGQAFTTLTDFDINRDGCNQQMHLVEGFQVPLKNPDTGVETHTIIIYDPNGDTAYTAVLNLYSDEEYQKVSASSSSLSFSSNAQSESVWGNDEDRFYSIVLTSDTTPVELNLSLDAYHPSAMNDADEIRYSWNRAIADENGYMTYVPVDQANSVPSINNTKCTVYVEEQCTYVCNVYGVNYYTEYDEQGNPVQKTSEYQIDSVIVSVNLHSPSDPDQPGNPDQPFYPGDDMPTQMFLGWRDCMIWNDTYGESTWQGNVYLATDSSEIQLFTFERESLNDAKLIVDGKNQTNLVRFDSQNDDCGASEHIVEGYLLHFDTPETGTENHQVEVIDQDGTVLFNAYFTVYSEEAYKQVSASSASVSFGDVTEGLTIVAENPDGRYYGVVVDASAFPKQMHLSVASYQPSELNSNVEGLKYSWNKVETVGEGNDSYQIHHPIDDANAVPSADNINCDITLNSVDDAGTYCCDIYATYDRSYVDEDGNYVSNIEEYVIDSVYVEVFVDNAGEEVDPVDPVDPVNPEEPTEPSNPVRDAINTVMEIVETVIEIVKSIFGKIFH